MKPLVAALAALLCLSVALVAQTYSSPEALLKAAQQREEVDGDDSGAIALYKRIVDQFPRDASAPIALARMAAIYERQRDTKAARSTHERLLKEYPQSTAAAQSRIVLSRMATAPAQAVPQRPPLGELVKGFNTRIDVAPDGTLVAGGRLTGSQNVMRAALDVRSIASGAERRLADNLSGFARLVRFSPDGARLAAYLITPGPAAATSPDPQSVDAIISLVIASVDTPTQPPIIRPIWSGPRTAAEGIFLQSLPWSPDGQSLAYPSNLSGKSEAFVLDTRNGNSRSLGVPLDGPADFVWSPDGQELAVRTGNRSFSIVTLSTGQSRHVTVDGTAGVVMRLGVWPAKTAIAVTRLAEKALPEQTEVSLVDLTSGKSTATCTGFPLLSGSDSGIGIFGGTADLCFGFSLDGRSELVWRHAEKRLRIHDAVTGVSRQFVTGFGEERGASIAPDGRLAVFFSNRNSRWGLYAAPITAEPAEPVLVARLDDLPTFAQFMWTKIDLVASIGFFDAHVMRVSMNPTTGRSNGPLQQLSQDSSFNNRPTLSPDGKRIAYFSRRNGLVQPAMMDADGANEQVLRVPADGIAMQWATPDQLVLANISDTTLRGGFFAFATGSGIRTPIKGSLPTYPEDRISWSLDRRQQEVVFAAVRNGGASIDFRARSVASGAERVVATIDGAAAPLDHFLLSPDGSKLAYLLSTQFSNVNHCAPCELGILDLTNGKRTMLPAPAMPTIPVAWSPDARFLLYGAARPRIMNVGTGESWTLMAPAEQPAWSQSGDWSPDGTFIVLSATSQRAEWHMWSDFAKRPSNKAKRP